MRRLLPATASSYELGQFTKQLATMLQAGIPSLQSCRILMEQGFSRTMSCAVSRLVESIEEGHSLSQGMARSPHVFDDLYLSLIRAGETIGDLPNALKRLAEHLERRLKLRRTLVTTAIYPSCLLATTALVSSLLLIFIIPSFKELFAEMDSQLPWLTRMVIATSDIFITCAPLLLFLFCLFCLMFSRLLKTARGRAVIDRGLSRIPVLGNLITKASLARITRTLGTTLGAGVPILLALDVSAKASGNSVTRFQIQRVCDNIAEGMSLSNSVQSSNFFPLIMVQMLHVGEMTGTLDTMLEKIAVFFEEEVEQHLAATKQLIEPAIILVLGVVVGTLVLAMYLPVFSMGGLFS